MSNKKIVKGLDNKPHKIERIIAPFGLHETDPKKKTNRVKSIKVLTNLNKRRIIDHVKKLKRKDDKMAKDKTKKSNKVDVAKSVAWLVEASFRAFVGWILLTNFDRYITTAAALYALGTAAVIVVAHFIKANR